MTLGNSNVLKNWKKICLTYNTFIRFHIFVFCCKSFVRNIVNGLLQLDLLGLCALAYTNM